MLRFLVLSSAILLAANASGQTNNSRADGFRGLILNQTTSEEAVRILGQPVTDKTDRLDVAKLSKWLDPKHKEKIFRQLSFKNVGDFSQIHLSFLENKLMMIELEFKKILFPARLNDLFGLEFAVIGAQGSPSDLPNEPGKYPVRFIPVFYPFNYNLIGISDKTFIWVDCSTGDARTPGKIDRSRQVSRVLEKK
ncbi:MAG: hypothetical protein DMF73_13850 [Acidobacteria bacterium]|nr:MAG: hypothetical protein DMF73_13850 [Acidobacteriota bacterium]